MKMASLAIAVLAGTFALGFPTRVLAGDDCAEAHARVQAWIKENEDRLPTTLEEVSRYPMAYRRAIVEALPSKQKADLWREHVRQYIASHPSVGAKQREVLELVIASINPQLFSSDITPELLRLEAAVKAAFGPEEARLIVATLGPPESLHAQGSPVGTCECNPRSAFCGKLKCRAASCMVLPGCGYMGRYQCNGFCE
ncbi:bacteriocin fulvocin C-related protein [Myxococcus stipitatus]